MAFRYIIAILLCALVAHAEDTFIVITNVSDIPELAVALSNLGTGSDQAYRGDHGAAVSNTVAARESQFTASPSTGAVWTSTGESGHGAWKPVPYIHAYSTNKQTTFNPISFSNIERQDGGVWDGTYWTPGVTGNLSVVSAIQLDMPSLPSIGYGIWLNKNDATLLRAGIYWTEAYQYPMPSGSFTYYNDNATNRYSVTMLTAGAISSTSRVNTASSTYFIGKVLP